MLRLSPKIAKPHEVWCLDVALQLCGSVTKHQVIRHNRIVDAILRMPTPVSHWGPLAEFLCRRDVLVEHFSDSVSHKTLASCREKIAYASYRYFSHPAAERERLHPVMVILSHRKPEKILREPDWFKSTEHRGIWRWGPLSYGPIFIVATSALEDTPDFEWLRMTTRRPETPEAFQSAARLIMRNQNDRIRLDEVEKTMLDFMYIDGVNVFDYAEEQKRHAEEQQRKVDELVEYTKQIQAELESTKRQLAALQTKLESE